MDTGRIIGEVIQAAILRSWGWHDLELLAEPLEKGQQAIDGALRLMLGVQQGRGGGLQVGDQRGLQVCMYLCMHACCMV